MTPKADQIPSRAQWGVLDATIRRDVCCLHVYKYSSYRSACAWLSNHKSHDIPIRTIRVLFRNDWLEEVGPTSSGAVAYTASTKGRAAWERGREKWGKGDD